MGMEIKDVNREEDAKNNILSSFNNTLSSCRLEICSLKGQEVGNKGVFTSYGGTMSDQKRHHCFPTLGRQTGMSLREK